MATFFSLIPHPSHCHSQYFFHIFSVLGMLNHRPSTEHPQSIYGASTDRRAACPLRGMAVGLICIAHIINYLCFFHPFMPPLPKC